MSLSESLKTAGQAVAYFPRLAKPLGSVNASILFGHFFYWSDRGSSELGIYKTAEEIEAETGLTRDEQRTARAKLRERGVLIETEKRIEHRIYYKLDLSAFDELMKNFQACANPQSAKSTIPNPEVGNSQSGSVDFPIDEVGNSQSGSVDFPIDEVGNSQSYIRTEDYQKITTVDYYSSNAHAEACATKPAYKPKAKAAKKSDAMQADLAALENLGVESQTAKDWLVTRKEKRAGSLTQTVLTALQREASKAGLTVAQAVQVAAERNWAQFVASYLQRESQGFTGAQSRPANKINAVPKHTGGGVYLAKDVL